MKALQTAIQLVLMSLLVSACVREEDALTDNGSDPIGNPPPNPQNLQMSAPPPAQSEATGSMTNVDLGQPSATGGDGTYTFSNDAPAAGFLLGTATVTWTVTDGAGATATGTQTVTVSDTSAPSITAPPDMQVDSTGAMTIVDIGSATVSDIADSNPAVSNDMPAAGFPLGTTTVTWSAVDGSGNAATATQMVTVSMPTGGPLTISAPAAISAEATAPATMVTLGAAMAAGGQAPIMIADNAPTGGFPVGATTVTWTATDAAMATATATQVVTITDTTAPTIAAPADITTDQTANQTNTDVALGTPTVADLADLAVTVSNDAPAAGFPVGTTNVTWTAQDASGNTATANQTVVVNAFVAQLCSAMVSEFATVIYPMMDSQSPERCANCHTGPTPLATANGFGFPNDPPTAADFDIFRTVAAIDSGGQSLVLVKSTGGAAHVGGDRFPAGTTDPDYQLLADFVSRATSCQEDPPVNPVTIERGSGYEQLHKVTVALVSRPPSDDETNAVDAAGANQAAIDAAISPIVDGLMNEAAFYTRVEEIYNDVLLTNKEADDRGNVGDNFDLDAFANRDYYEDNFSGNERSDLREDTNYGFARAPVELIRYVIENNRPFTEVVSADYTMVNPYSAVIYGVDAGDNSFPFSSDNNRANHDRDDFRPISTIRQSDNTLVPAAGIVGTHSFLARYPSTNTNVNRARARYVFDYFLGIDIESLASRDGLDLDNVIGDVPTFEDPQCTVCHDVMDPIAGLFTNRDNDGEYDTNNTFQHTRNVNGVPRMVPAGYSLAAGDELPGIEEDTALQWLGGKLAADDRFAERTVRTVLKGLTGIEPSSAAATAFVNTTKTDFVASGFDFRELVKAIVSSDFFLAENLANGENPSGYPDVGMGRLTSAEELDRKVTAMTDGSYQWRGPNSNSGLVGRHYLLYGGIDSDEVVVRTTSPNSLIDGVQERIANQVACEQVAADLINQGNLFPIASLTDTPDGAAGTDAIRQNMQYLHRRLLGEDLAVDDAELSTTYQLFVDVRAAGETDIPSQCRGGGSSNDDNGTVIPWMAVVTYLLSDYRFVYE